MLDPHLSELLNHRPSILRNSFVVWLVYIAFSILFFVFAFAGIGCVVGGDFQELLVLDPMVKIKAITPEVAKQLKDETKILGIILLILGSLFSLVVWLCKKLIERNLFLMELEDWRIKEEEKLDIQNLN